MACAHIEQLQAFNSQSNQWEAAFKFQVWLVCRDLRRHLGGQGHLGWYGRRGSQVTWTKARVATTRTGRAQNWGSPAASDPPEWWSAAYRTAVAEGSEPWGSSRPLTHLLPRSPLVDFAAFSASPRDPRNPILAAPSATPEKSPCIYELHLLLLLLPVITITVYIHKINFPFPLLAFQNWGKLLNLFSLPPSCAICKWNGCLIFSSSYSYLNKQQGRTYIYFSLHT